MGVCDPLCHAVRSTSCSPVTHGVLRHGVVLGAFWDAAIICSSWLQCTTVSLRRTGLVSQVSQSTKYSMFDQALQKRSRKHLVNKPTLWLHLQFCYMKRPMHSQTRVPR